MVHKDASLVDALLTQTSVIIIVVSIVYASQNCVIYVVFVFFNRA